MPRFVILEHDFPSRHWDLMLEAGQVLRTWRLLQPPSPGSSVLAESSLDHRLLYLDYEGPVSGNRGTVQRWDAGSYEGNLAVPPVGGCLHLNLRGEQVQGVVVLERLGEAEWLLQLATPPAVSPK